MLGKGPLTAVAQAVGAAQPEAGNACMPRVSRAPIDEDQIAQRVHVGEELYLAVEEGAQLV